MAVQMLSCLAEEGSVFLAGFWKEVEEGLLGASCGREGCLEGWMDLKLCGTSD